MYFLEQLKFSHFEDSIIYTLIALSVYISLFYKVTWKKNSLILYIQHIKRCLKIGDHKKQLKKNITHADIAELLLFVNLMVTATYKNNILTKMKHLP